MLDQLLSSALTVGSPPDCATQAGSWCAQVWAATKIGWLAESANWLIVKPLHILLILVFAIVARLIAHRTIDQLTRDRAVLSKTKGKRPAILRPLREHAPGALTARVSERRTQRATTIGSILKSIVSFVVWGVAVVLVLGDLGFNLTPIIASAGVIGVAVGFGAQNLVKDFLSGVFMLLEDQYGVGDVVDIGPAVGTVESVGLRITTLRDHTGTVWYVRNGAVERVGNSTQGFAVAVVDVPVAYGTDVNHALALLSKVATEASGAEPLVADVLESPQVLGVQGMAKEHITVRLTVKVRPAKQWSTQRELRRQIMAAFDSAGFAPPLGRPGSADDDE